jgi:hypothetical protein
MRRLKKAKSVPKALYTPPRRRRWKMRLMLGLSRGLALAVRWFYGTDEHYYVAMEDRIYDDLYKRIRGGSKSAVYIIERQRTLLGAALGVARADRMLVRLKRRCDWEDGVRPQTMLPIDSSNAIGHSRYSCSRRR